MNLAYLERRDPAANMARFYAASIVPTLFGDWALVREWGRIGSPGTVRADWFAAEHDAVAAGENLVEAKRRRGCRRCAGFSGL
jgi:predicted DNA-binding WGR domain protein